MELKHVFAAALCYISYTTAAPAILAAPFALPSTFPDPSYNLTVPTHFGLFGYSFDGTIFNQSYYANGQPCNRNLWGFLNRPQDAYANGTYGSYAFGLGNQSHLFAFNDGRIAITTAGAAINWMLFESWSNWWHHKDSGEPASPIPTCEILPYFNLLVCDSEGQRFKFAYCQEGVPEGVGYTAGTMVWGTDITPCTEIVLQVRQVPKTYGNQFPGKNCSA